MNTTIILAHPNLEGGSIANSIITEAVSKIPSINIRNLYELYPGFRIDVDAEQECLVDSDLIVFQFPFYWYNVPGILKQWEDVVLTYGFAYGSTGDKLRGKNFLASITVGGPESSYSSSGYNSFTIGQFLRPLEQLANLCGMKYNEPIYTYDMVYIPDVYNVKEEVEERARNHADRLVSFIENLASRNKSS